MNIRRINTALALVGASCVLMSTSGYAQTAGTTANSNAMQTYFINISNPFDPTTVCGDWFNQNAGTDSPRAKIQASTQQGIDNLGLACDAYFRQVAQGKPPVTAVAFMDAITPDDFVAFKLDALLFAQSENDNAMDRMQALRRKHAPSDKSASAQQSVLGGGASADESSDMLTKKLGLWFRLNNSGGKKDVTALTGKLDNSQFAGAVGMDYRLGAETVLGGSLGYRNAKAKFGDSGAQGSMDSKTFNISGYFSSYVYKSMYLDTVLNYGNIKYNTHRNVLDLSVPPVPYTAFGKTNGKTLSGGVALGYEFAPNAWTITPSVHYFYTDSKTDAFEEEGSGAYDLNYGKQHYQSSSARLDLNVSYAVNGNSAVWLPHFRTEMIKEFGANIDTFDVRFVNASNPTLAPLPVQLDKMDDLYFRVTLGVSAQFRNDIAAYLDYQQLVGFDKVTFYNVVAGMRLQF